MLRVAPKDVVRFVTAEEAVELARIQKDSSIIGYALMTFEGDEIESSGVWSATLAPVFANVFDIADKLGEEIGEEDTCPMVYLERPDFEIVGILMSAARAVVSKRKHKHGAEGLRSVG